MNLHALRSPDRDPRHNILGNEVFAINWSDGIALLGRLIRDKHFTKISFLNAHSANMAFGNPELADAFADFLILPDGIGVDIAAQILHGAPFPANLNGTDFVPAFLAATQAPVKVALLGATSDNIRRAARALSEATPQHEFIILNDGFFREEDEPRILAELKRLRPDILLVAMGVPRQELWISRNITAEHCTLPIAVGALFDFLSGAMPRAPLWMRRMRLEWMFRLLLEPARLFDRYVVGNPLFLSRVLRQKTMLVRAHHDR
ncbi:MAG TPA: WecB/TagA/CpsF family glycosyltransferase [Rhizobiaceae bacterium]|nr:WecB/TagA/CpsF family glycosyltransferase [Rhizobiaceae bacterium]